MLDNIQTKRKMKTWITSDNHFGHKGILNFCPDTRKYESVEQMDAVMIYEWNKTIAPNDKVFILGDLSFHKVEKSIELVSGLNGYKILIAGNHDEGNLRDARFRALFGEVHELLVFRHDNTRISMCHYPIAEWRDCHRGGLMFHGHLHGNTTNIKHLSDYRIKDVGVDANDGSILDFEEVIFELKQKKILTHQD